MSLDKIPNEYYVKRIIVEALDNYSTSMIEELDSYMSKLTDDVLVSSIRESIKDLKASRMDKGKSRNKDSRPSGMVSP